MHKTFLLLVAAVALHAADPLGRYLTALPNSKSRAAGPRAYVFTCDYFYMNTRGDVSGKHRLVGTYTRGLSDGSSRWSDVTMASAKGFDDVFPSGEKIEFMEGFTYRPDAEADLTRPEFFRGFPPAAMRERNLIWDTAMLELFVSKPWAQLKLNTPYRFESSHVPLAGAGSFQNKAIDLIWTGVSRRNGRDCGVIRYDAYFNRFDIKMPGFEFAGRSHYWGEIWAALDTRDLEYATLFEDVLGEQKTGGGQSGTVNVFRRGTFEPVPRNGRPGRDPGD